MTSDQTPYPLYANPIPTIPEMIAEANDILACFLKSILMVRLVTCTVEKQTAYICEVNQAGIFIAKNINQDGLEFLLNGAAPNILFPYAREHISTLVNKATFPPLTLRPINFEAMYRSRQQEAAAAAAAKSDVANGADSEQAPQA